MQRIPIAAIALFLLVATVSAEDAVSHRVDLSSLKKAYPELASMRAGILTAYKSGNKVRYGLAVESAESQLADWIGEPIEWELLVGSVDKAYVLAQEPKNDAIRVYYETPPRNVAYNRIKLPIGSDVSREFAASLNPGRDMLKVSATIKRIKFTGTFFSFELTDCKIVK